MKKLRIFLLLFFVVTAAVFGATWIRNYMNRDVTPPVIEADQDEITVPVGAGDDELLAGLTATDNKDGDVTGSLVVVSRSKFISDATLKVVYAAFDKHNNVGTYTRKVTYSDYVPPHFTLTQPPVYRSGQLNTEPESLFGAEDCLDGDLSGQIRVSYVDETAYSIDTGSDEEADVPILVTVTNSAGDTAELSLKLRILPDKEYQTPAPALSQYVVYTKAGQTPDLEALKSGIWYSGSVQPFTDDATYSAKDISVDSAGLDVNTPGVYEVTYSLNGSSVEMVDNAPVTTSYALGKTTLYVVVEE
ncbi:MAG: hypothetical protein UHN88_00380 [Eubacterium sp.]|nr:hypothetical protein [Eubacterium sp.]